MNLHIRNKIFQTAIHPLLPIMKFVLMHKKYMKQYLLIIMNFIVIMLESIANYPDLYYLMVQL